MARLIDWCRREYDRWLIEWVEDHADAMRDEQDPMRPFRVLDRVLLGQFLLTGAQTREGLVESAPAFRYELSPSVVSTWMEAARKRGLIVRRPETHNVEDQPLPMAEWELTQLGREKATRFARFGEARQIIKITLALVALVGPALSIARAAGYGELPSWTWTLAAWLAVVLALLITLTLLPNEAQTRAASRVAVGVLKERGILPP